LVANVAAGILYSPATRIRSVRVVGAREDDKERIRGRLEKLKDIPYMQANLRRVESDLQTYPGLRKAELKGNLFGRATLKLEYRRPIARLLDSANMAMDEEGVFFRMPELPENLYRIRVETGLLAPSATIAWQVETGKLASLCRKLRDLPAFDGATLVFDRRQGLSLWKESRRIVFGPPDGMEQKLATLEKAMLDLRWPNVVEMNLMAPSNPVVRLREPGNP
jgi:hypothetical protein